MQPMLIKKIFIFKSARARVQLPFSECNLGLMGEARISYPESHNSTHNSHIPTFYFMEWEPSSSKRYPHPPHDGCMCTRLRALSRGAGNDSLALSAAAADQTRLRQTAQISEPDRALFQSLCGSLRLHFNASTAREYPAATRVRFLPSFSGDKPGERGRERAVMGRYNVLSLDYISEE